MNISLWLLLLCNRLLSVCYNVWLCPSNKVEMGLDGLEKIVLQSLTSIMWLCLLVMPIKLNRDGIGKVTIMFLNAWRPKLWPDTEMSFALLLLQCYVFIQISHLPTLFLIFSIFHQVLIFTSQFCIHRKRFHQFVQWSFEGP